MLDLVNQFMSSAESEPPRFTYGDYLQWDDGERWELIDGRAYSMAPAPSVPHQRLVTELAIQLGSQLRGSPCEAFVAPLDVRFPRAGERDEDITDVVQPDLVIVCDASKLDERGCRGAPDFVVEVLSASTAARDQIAKLDLYERHGVREYWLIHPIERVVTVYRRGDDGRYDRPMVNKTQGTTPVTALPTVRVDWGLVFARSDASN